MLMVKHIFKTTVLNRDLSVHLKCYYRLSNVGWLFKYSYKEII